MMDQPVITEEREAVPEWAKASDAQAPDPDRATDRQMGFIESLLQERELNRLSEEQLGCLNSEHFMSTLNKANASKIIEALLKLPKKPVETKNDVSQGFTMPFLKALAPGRYAIENNDGELRFYQVWQSPDGKHKRLYVQHSDDRSPLPARTQDEVARKILEAGAHKCAVRYGMEIGSCSHCGRTLTNRISRELGIGPICGGRMFGDNFKADVKEKRAEIIARGQDPNEEMS